MPLEHRDQAHGTKSHDDSKLESPSPIREVHPDLEKTHQLDEEEYNQDYTTDNHHGIVDAFS